MEQPQKYEAQIEKNKAVAEVAWKLENRQLAFTTDLEPLRNEFLRLYSLRDEVIAAVKILLETDMLLVKAQIRADEIGATGDPYGKLKAQGSASTAEVWTRMSLSWKIFMYSVRCFQDCIYKAILHAQRESAGAKASMATCLSGDAWRDESGVGKLIITHLPAYPDWFIRARTLRNKLKKGLSVKSVWSGREPEHFIVLCEQRWNGLMIEEIAQYPIKFDFAAESLEMCIAVTDLILIAFDEVQARKLARCTRMKEKESDLSPGSKNSGD